MKKKLKNFYFRPDFYYETAKDFCFHLGFNPDDIANLTGVTHKTAAKWINTNQPPPWLLPFLYAVNGGVISCKDFYGWRLADGYVINPGIKKPLTFSEIESLPWYMETMRQYQATIRDMRGQLATKKPVKTGTIIQLDKYRD